MTETVVQNEQLRRYVETHHIDMIPAGPLVKDLGGADLSWIVGFIVAALVYLALAVTGRTETGRHDRQMATSGRW